MISPAEGIVKLSLPFRILVHSNCLGAVTRTLSVEGLVQGFVSSQLASPFLG